MTVAAIVAGGTGTRMGGTIPKQFLTVGDKIILQLTVESFLAEPSVDLVAVGVHPDWEEYAKELLKDYGSRVTVTVGGFDRSGTLLNILEAAERLGADDNTVVLSHDAVRPFVTSEIIRANITAMKTEKVCTTAISAVDTILSVKDGSHIDFVPNRKELFQAQTPQSFLLGEYKSLLSDLSEEERNTVTDVCGVYLRRNIPVGIVPGSPENIKITTPFDLTVAKAILEKRK